MRFNSAQLDFIQERAHERITEVLDALGIDYTERRDYIQAACPVHGGDNPRAWYWALSSTHWRCATKHCEKSDITGPSTSVFGLVRGVMSRKTGQPWSFNQAVTFVAGILNVQGVKIAPRTAEELEIDKAIKAYRKRRSQAAANAPGILLADIVPRLAPDTEYYPTRGVSPEIIARYHISWCDDPDRPFHHRAFFPVLDETGRYVVGWSARSAWPKCPQCKLYHDPVRDYCPTKKEAGFFQKWRHSAGFRSERHLYNIWYAKPFIAKTQVAVVVEGPGDVWAYETAGVRNSVAMLGLNFSDIQRQALQRAGALTLVFTVDNDASGEEAKERLTKELQWYFRLIFVTPDSHDIDTLGSEGIEATIKPILEHFSKAGALRDEYSAKENV